MAGHVVSWRDKAACLGTDSNLFFLDNDGRAKVVAKRAKAICARCPVQTECFDYAIETRQPYGIWGGVTKRQRRRFRETA